jgi:RHS repeat-associated protein
VRLINKYNSKELQETGMYDYGWRQYMSDIGRWNGIDMLAEKYNAHNPYNYVMNNPMMLIDPNGMSVVGTGGMSGWEKKSWGGNLSLMGSMDPGSGIRWRIWWLRR